MKTQSAAPKNLGESLAALAVDAIPDAIAIEHFKRGESKLMGGSEQVLVSDIAESKTNARKKFERIEELAASIEQNGLIEPLIVRKHPTEPGYELIAGHRRLRALKLLKARYARVEEREATDVQVLEMQSVENNQREGLNLMEQAAEYKQLQEAAGYTVPQIAEKMGVSVATVYGRLKLFDLCPELRIKLLGGHIEASVAIPLARITTARLQLQAFNYIVEHDLTAREAIEYIQSGFTINLDEATFDKKDAFLVEGAPSCFKCLKRSGGVPGLFDDCENGKTCTDVPCFKLKTAATWNAQVEKFEKKGAEVLSIAETAKVMPNGNLPHASKYVKADTDVDGVKKTWSELIDKLPEDKRPQLVVAPDRSMKPVRLFNETEARKALQAAGRWPKRAVESSNEKVTQAKQEDPAIRDARNQVVDAVLVKLAVGVKKKGFTLPIMRTIAMCLARHPDRPIAQALGGPAEGELTSWLTEKADRETLLALLFVEGVSESFGGTWQGINPELVDLAKDFGIDVKQLERDALEPIQAAAAEKAAAEKESKKAK